MGGPWEKYQQAPDAKGGAAGPWTKYQPDPNADPEPTLAGAGQAFLEHAGDNLAMGYLPHIQAALQPDMDKALDLVTGKNVTQSSKAEQVLSAMRLLNTPTLMAQVLKQAIVPDKGYVKARDENKERIDQEGADYPVASTAGDVAGLVGGAALTSGFGTLAKAPAGAGLIARGAVAAKNIGTAAARGAVQAGLWNPGDTQGQAGGLQLPERLENAKRGAEIGAATQGVFEAAPLVKGVVKAAGAKIGSTLSGETPEIVANYAKNTDKINQIIQESEGDVTEMTDKAREKLQQGLRDYRSELSTKVRTDLKDAPVKASISLQPVIDELEKGKERFNPIFDQPKINQVDAIIAKVKEAGAPESYGKMAGQANAFWTNEVKEYLQKEAKSSYMQSGQIFMNDPEVAQVAKSGGAVARQLVNKAAPSVAAANDKLAALHAIEDDLNTNLIAPGKSDTALLAAGSGSNPRNANMLEKLGKLTGLPAAETAKDLATARAFANPALLPKDATGKAVARMVLASGVGTAVGGVAGGPVGAIMGSGLGALASPAAVKVAINAGNNLGKLAAKIPAISQGAQKGAGYVANAIGSKIRTNDAPAESPATPEVVSFFQKNPAMLEKIQDPGVKKQIQDAIGGPVKGEAKWMQNGAQALQLSPEQTRQLVGTVNGRQLLIQASDLKAGSPAMKKLSEKIQKELRGNQ